MSIASRARHTKRPNNTRRHVPNMYGCSVPKIDAITGLDWWLNRPLGAYKFDGTNVKRGKQEPK